MQSWKWLYTPEKPFSGWFLIRVVIKTVLLFAGLNVLFALAEPLPWLGKLSVYNHLFEGRARLPYGENPAAAYNLSLYQLDAMFASHTLAGDDPPGDVRVLLIGDSAVWGILLHPEDTLAGKLNAGDYHAAAGQPVRAYNLGYPTMSLLKDLMLLDYAMRYDPDVIVWLFTLESFDQIAQLDSAIVQNNANRVQRLIAQHDLDQDQTDPRFVERSFWERTIIGQRRALADMLRLQYYGVAWTLTGIDQEYRDDYTPRAIDLEPSDTWHGFSPGELDADDLALDILHAGVALAGDTPVLFVNEPMLISTGENSDIRYNAFYPRWAYDRFRQIVAAESAQAGWWLLDLWDYLPDAACYTDSAVHLTPDCSAQLAGRLGPIIRQIVATGTFSPDAVQ